jgi:NAD(P)-dependent dehydrogenase (short-subunit alcohol dehydrogenase family)
MNVIVITGASDGIGAEIARQLAGAGKATRVRHLPTRFLISPAGRSNEFKHLRHFSG